MSSSGANEKIDNFGVCQGKTMASVAPMFGQGGAAQPSDFFVGQHPLLTPIGSTKRNGDAFMSTVFGSSNSNQSVSFSASRNPKHLSIFKRNANVRSAVKMTTSDSIDVVTSEEAPIDQVLDNDYMDK